MLLGGVLADRISPRDLALGVERPARGADDDRRASWCSATGSRSGIWPLVGVVFGTVDAVFLPAINTLVPRLVPPSRLAAANALMQGTAQLIGTVGPAIAGFRHRAHRRRGRPSSSMPRSFAVAALALWLVRSGATAGSADGTGRPSRPSRCGARPLPDPSRHTTAPARTPPPASIAQRADRGRANRPRRPGHALDRHRLDGHQPGLHRADRRRPAVARPRRLRRRRTRAGPAVRGIRCRLAGRRRARWLAAAAAPVRMAGARRWSSEWGRPGGDQRGADVPVAAVILLADRRHDRLRQRRHGRLGPGEDRPADARPDDELPDARVGRRRAAVARPRRASLVDTACRRRCSSPPALSSSSPG